jgi:hypothetical protein
MGAGDSYWRFGILGFWLCFLMICTGRAVLAHDTKGFETANFEVHEKALTCTFRGPDVDFMPQCGVNAVEMRGEETADKAKEKFGAWLDTMLQLQANGKPLQAEVESLTLLSNPAGNFVEAELKYPTASAANRLTVLTSFSPQIMVSFGGLPLAVKSDTSQTLETGKSASVAEQCRILQDGHGAFVCRYRSHPVHRDIDFRLAALRQCH